MAMERLRRWFIGIVILIVIGGGFWLWWTLDLRWRPHAITKNQTQIARVLDGAGWVSPHLRGRQIYLIAYRDCPACTALETALFPQLQAGGVDTRVIIIARPDANGLVQSSPAERATVAELWTNRDWSLFQRWMAASSPSAWTAPGIAPADGDAARTAVIEAGRHTLDDLRPLLKRNGVGLAYPTLIWWTKAGVMHACVCDKPASYGPVKSEMTA
jgi:hypothetical protein